MKQKDYYTSTMVESYAGIERALEDREKKSLKMISTIAFNNESVFLDAGCGDGKFLMELKSMIGEKLKYEGCDYSEYRCEQARQNTRSIIHQINFESQTDLPNSYFECVYSGEVLEHLYNPDNMIVEINRILKPGGKLILTTPNMNSWISRIFFLFGIQPLNYECSTVSSLYGYSFLKKIKKQDWPIGHVRLFNKLSLVDILEANGFIINEIQGVSFEFMPKPLRVIDKIFNVFPSLASGFVVSAIKNK